MLVDYPPPSSIPDVSLGCRKRTDARRVALSLQQLSGAAANL